jgi:phosphatidylglycerophosphatase A
VTNDRASRRRLPSGLSFFHPVVLIATVGGAGLLPRAPGTWGSLVALPFAWIIAAAFGPIGLVIGCAAATLLGAWAAGRFAGAVGFSDPAPVVIDEVAGQWLVLAVAPLDPVWYAVGFVLFRVADIVKPWPVSLADRRVKGGWGVMLDDLIAAVYGVIVLYAIVRLSGASDVFG